LQNTVVNPRNDIVDGPFGSNLKASEYQDAGIPIIRLQNVQRNQFVDKNIKFVSPEKASELSRHSFVAGDIAVTKLGDPLGKAAIVPPTFPEGIIVADIVRIRVDPKYIDTRYVTYAVNSPETIAALALETKGTTRPRVNLGHIRSLEIPLAPTNEQRRLADKLDVFLSKVNSCRERLDRVPQLLKKFREAVLEAAVSGRLTEEWRGQQPPASVDAKLDVETILKAHITAGGHRAGNAAPPTSDVHDLDGSMFPKKWGLVDLRDAIEPGRPITYGILKPGPEVSEGVSYVRVADYPGNRLNLDTVRKTSKSIESEFARARLRTGDLLLSIRGTVGRLIVIPSELEGANITQDSARLSIQECLNKDFVRLYLSAPMAQQRMRRATKGVAVRGINIGDVRALQLPIPSLSEQREISRRVNELFALADSLQRRYQNTVSFAERLTPSVLAKAFRGELVPQDQNDEPAGEMLDRVKREREEVPMVAKKKVARRMGRAAIIEAPDQVKAVGHTEKYTLTPILKKQGRLRPEALLQSSGLGIDEFYDQLKIEEAKGLLKEVRAGKGQVDRWIEAVK
jgi:type I restriction enzyme S subunit